MNLVVLSACATARGKQTRGDEVVGLTRASSMVDELAAAEETRSGTVVIGGENHDSLAGIAIL